VSLRKRKERRKEGKINKNKGTKNKGTKNKGTKNKQKQKNDRRIENQSKEKGKTRLALVRTWFFGFGRETLMMIPLSPLIILLILRP
jgi:hypothetical protein